MKTKNFVQDYLTNVDETVVVKKDGSVSFVPLTSIINYDEDRNFKGTGVTPIDFLKELNAYGEVHIAKVLGRKENFTPLKKEDIVEIYSLKIGENYRKASSPLVVIPPKKGLRRLLARLSNF
jgi:hypothetical protein